MLFWIERFGRKVLVDALLNCGRWLVTFWEEGKKIPSDKYSWLMSEAEGYIKMFSDKPIEFS